jgi:hypothetical protein
VALRTDDDHYLRLDLPELEDVISETTEEILKNGETREVRRLKAERNGDYAHLCLTPFSSEALAGRFAWHIKY